MLLSNPSRLCDWREFFNHNMNMKKLALYLTLFCLAVANYSAPADKTTYMVPMRDGVKLATDVFKPNTSFAYPVILYRTPYNKDHDGFGEDIITLLNAFGYVYVAQDCRGRFHSEGTDSVFVTDGWGALQDGYDTIDWIVQQPWCNGKVAMIGGSATGITTLRAAGALHPNLVCAAVLVAPSDFYHQVVYPGGEFRKSLNENWVHDQGSDYMIPYFLKFPWYNELWEQMNLHTRTPLITIPILHIGGWYDCFSDGTILAFQDLQSQPNAGYQKLIVGPWVHGSPSGKKVGELRYPDANFDYENLLLRWLNWWMRGIPGTLPDEPAVTYYLMGDPDAVNEPGCQWLEGESWPPENIGVKAFYLSASGLMTSDLPDTGRATYLFDPNDPVPTLGGNNLTIARGPYDQRALGTRGDVLSFTTEPLTRPLRIEGFVKARLFISSNCRDTDFTLKLIDVYPDGREMLVTDGIQRARFRRGYRQEDESLLVPGQIDSLEIHLPPTALVFNSGHRIKVDISSSNYPRFEANPNTGNSPNDRSNPQIAENRVYFGGERASFVELPVVQEPSGVAVRQSLPTTFELYPNYPNPFNAGTTISFSLYADERIHLDIVNLLGQPVRQLAAGYRSAGFHTLVWDGRDELGQSLPSGVYLVRLTSGQYSAVSRAALIK